MKALHDRLFFLPYPQALILHLILGAILGAIFGMVLDGYRGDGYAWPVYGGVLFSVLAFLLHIYYTRKK